MDIDSLSQDSYAARLADFNKKKYTYLKKKILKRLHIPLKDEIEVDETGNI